MIHQHYTDSLLTKLNFFRVGFNDCMNTMIIFVLTKFDRRLLRGEEDLVRIDRQRVIANLQSLTCLLAVNDGSVSVVFRSFPPERSLELIGRTEFFLSTEPRWMVCGLPVIYARRSKIQWRNNVRILRTTPLAAATAAAG